MMAYKFLYLSIDVFLTLSSIRCFIVCNIMNVMLSAKINCDNPRAWHNNFINPSAVFQDFRSLPFIVYNFTLFLNSFLVSTHSHNQVHMWEKLLSLFKYSSMANVIHIKHSICIYSHWVVWISSIWLYLYQPIKAIQRSRSFLSTKSKKFSLKGKLTTPGL